MKMNLKTYILFAALCLPGTGLPGLAQTADSIPAAPDIPEAYTRSADSLALYIDACYDNDTDKAQAIYSWIAHNMTYNVYTTFTSRNEVYSEAKDLQETLRTRTGICKQFALLFKTVAEKVGIPAYIVSGYNKFNGALLPSPHEWCAAKIGAQWYFYDPTFGMGYIDSNSQFVHDPTLKYCHADPRQLIRTHMPYDPIWQLLEQPYRYEEFDKDTYNPQADPRPVCHFNDSILAYTRQTRSEQLAAGYNRALRNGTPNPLVDYYLELTQANIKIYQQQKVYDIYKEAMKLQNMGADLANDFIRYRRQAFQPEREEDEVRGLLRQASEAASTADSLMHTAGPVPDQYASAMANLQSSIDKLTEQIGDQQAFVELYYSTPSKQRKRLFQ